MLGAILPGLSQSQPVLLRTHPSILPDVLAQIQALRTARLPSIDAEADAAMSPGDIALNWRDGAATRSAGRIMAEIDTILGLNGFFAEPSTITSNHTIPARMSDAHRAGQEHDHVG